MRRRLDPADRSLHLRIERLHAEADTRDARDGDGLRPARIETTRIDLDRQDRAGTVERRPDALYQPNECRRRECVGTATAKGDPSDARPTSADAGGDEQHLALEPFDIGGQPRIAVGRARVAPAIPANVPAIGDVKIERDGRFGRKIRQCRLHVAGSDIVAKLGGGRIAGVARHRRGEQFRVIGPHAMMGARSRPYRSLIGIKFALGHDQRRAGSTRLVRSHPEQESVT